MSAPSVEDRHEWLSFEDPDEDRTWVFDLTFLTSRWSCIYGRGCQGILTGPSPELMQGCCTHGAHFTDTDDFAGVVRAVSRLTDEYWQHREAGERDGWYELDAEGSHQTRVLDDACIFLNRPGFVGGAGCAFHVAALAAGERFIDWKPDVCWQLPIRLESHTDDYGHVTSMLREWKRRDWGEGGFEFHWWCLDSHEAFVGEQPVYRYLRDELVEMVGEAVYDLLVGQIEARRASSYLPHPAVRR
jgi:hypothetical protein